MFRIASIVLAALAVHGCGGGHSGPSRSSPPNDIRVDRTMPGAGGGIDWPQIACDGSTVVAVWQDFRNFGGAICFNRSTDGGVTWANADVRLDHGSPLGGFANLPSIACSGSSVVVVWQDQRDGLHDIYFNRSTDGGVTWLPVDVRLDTDVAGSGDSQNPQVCISGTGVYVVWEEKVGSTFTDIYFNGSSDGGATWLPASLRLDTDPAGTAYSFNPKIACAGANVFVTWSDYRTLNWTVRMNRSANGGASWLGADVRLDHVAAGKTATSPLIAAAGANVYVAWHDDRNGKFDIFFNRSADSGTSWLAADVRLETDAIPHESWLYDLVASGTGVYAAWIDERNGGNSIYFTRSADSGATWLAADIRLDKPASGAQGINPHIVVSGSTVHAAWTDFRSTTDWDIYYNRSTNGGVSWLSSDVRLDHGGTSYAIPLSLACAGSRVVVAWRDGRNSFGTADRTAVYVSSSSNDGAAWTAQDSRVSQTLPAGINGVSASPAVATSGTSVYVAWIDYREGPQKVFFNRSTDSGTTWETTDVRLGDAAAAPGTTVRIACSGSHVFVLWDDARNGSSDLYFTRSLDGGSTWLPADVRVDTDAPGTGVAWPGELSCVGDDLMLVWTDVRSGNSDIYMSRSTNGGATWLASDVRVDHAPGGAQSASPVFRRNGSSVFVAWQDNRNGQNDIYFNRSTDNGATWMGADIRLDTDAAGASMSLDPDLACSGSNVWVIWWDVRNGGQEIRLNRSADGGATWQPADLRIDKAATNAAQRYRPRLAVANGALLAVWEDSRGGSTGIYVNRSTDGAATWLAADVRIDSNPNLNGPSVDPRIISRGGTVFVVWTDCRDMHPGSNDTDLYYTASTDGGLTWRSPDVRLDIGDAAHKEASQVVLSWDGVWPVAVWTDLRNGAQDIFFSGLHP